VWVTSRWLGNSELLTISLSGLFAGGCGPNSDVDLNCNRELTGLISWWDLPWCIGGDFDVACFNSERSRAIFSPAMKELYHF
jgi:hypothetical protein